MIFDAERRRLYDGREGDWFVIAWQGATGRFVAEAKRGNPFFGPTGLTDGLIDPAGEVQCEFGDTADDALTALRAALKHV